MKKPGKNVRYLANKIDKISYHAKYVIKAYFTYNSDQRWIDINIQMKDDIPRLVGKPNGPPKGPFISRMIQ